MQPGSISVWHRVCGNCSEKSNSLVHETLETLTSHNQAACSARIPLARIVELLGELHIYIPRVILDKYFFTIDTTIHVLLYQIFATYMDCLASVISGLNSEQPRKSPT